MLLQIFFIIVLISMGLASSFYFIHLPDIRVQMSAAYDDDDIQKKPIFGKVTEISNNFTVGVNGSLVVSLAFIYPNSTDQTTHEDGVHYMSVVCPIRSPVIILPVSDYTRFNDTDSSMNLTKLSGIVYCQTSNMSDINSEKSINEQLVDANLASLDVNGCNDTTFLWIREYDYYYYC